MKTLLLILALAISTYALPDCYKNYSQAVEKIDNIYKKNQYRYSQAYKDQYYYEIFPTTLYPMFMVNPDTVKKIPLYGDIYLCNTTIGLHLDKLNIKHIQIAILQYIKSPQPSIKTYTMYFLKYDPFTKNWIDDRSPITVTLVLKNDGTYKSK